MKRLAVTKDTSIRQSANACEKNLQKSNNDYNNGILYNLNGYF